MLNKIKLKWKLFAYILIYSILVIFIFVFFQVLMLETFYRNAKLSALDSLFDEAETIILNNDMNNNETKDNLMNMSRTEEATIVLYSSSDEVYFETGFSESSRENDEKLINKIKELAPKNKKFYVTKVPNIPNRPGMKNEIVILDNLKEFKKISTEQSIICGKFITYNGETNCLLFTESRLTPVTPAVNALKNQLLYISVIVLILAIIVAFLISLDISTPIKRMTDSAKKLALGDRDIMFMGHGFSEIVELNKALNYAVVELNKSDTLQKELLANISHDLKTPLTLISGYAEMMMDIPEENNKENLQLIIDEVSRLTELVNDLVPLARMQAGTEVFNIEDYDLTNSIKNIVDRQNKLLSSDGYHITFDYQEDVCIEADVHKMEQVIYNFISNAVNYSIDNKNIEVSQIVNDNKVKIMVKDHGIGIKEEDKEIIWNRYYRVDRTHKRSKTGSGLGLSIAKGILDYHKFGYGVDSKLGEYSIFYFEAPVKEKK